MSRRLTTPLMTAAIFVGLAVLLGTLEGGFDNSADATNRLGVIIVFIAGAVAAGVGWQYARRDLDEPGAMVAVIAPVAVLTVGLALLSDAGTVTNVALALAGPLGAGTGVAVSGRLSR